MGVIPPGSIDDILTSPPYFNAIDYPRSYKFSHWWLWPERQPLGRSDYLGLMSGGKDRDEVVDKCYSITPEYRERIEAITEVSLTTHRNLCKYINELREVVVQFDLLIQGGKASFVVGTQMLHTGTQYAVIQQYGFSGISADQFLSQQSGLADVNNFRILELLIPARRRYPYGIAECNGTE